MPIRFSINPEEGYYIARYMGLLTENSVLDSWKKFYEGNEWKPSLNELEDLSSADFSEINADAIRSLVNYKNAVYKKHNVGTIKDAIYAPNSLRYGLARIYTVFAEESPEKTRIFNDINEAKLWLTEN
jgi:hypothetical protein